MQFSEIIMGPVVAVNVLDPTDHKIVVTPQPETITNGQVVIDEEGILLNSVVVKDSTGETTYEKDKDYTSEFNKDGFVVIKIGSDRDYFIKRNTAKYWINLTLQ